MYYYLLQLVLLGWSTYLQLHHKLSDYQLIMIVFVSLIVELLVSLNKKVDNLEMEEEEEEKK